MDISTNTSFGVNTLPKAGFTELTDGLLKHFHTTVKTSSEYGYVAYSYNHESRYSGTGSNIVYDNDGSIVTGNIDTISILSQSRYHYHSTTISGINATVAQSDELGFWQSLLDGDNSIRFTSLAGEDAYNPPISIQSGSGNDTIIDTNTGTYGFKFRTINKIDAGAGDDQIHLLNNASLFEITLGDGADQILQQAQEIDKSQIGLRTIKDFNPAEDTIILPSNEAGTTIYHIVDTDAGAVLRSTGANASDIMLLEGISLNQIQMKDGIISGKDGGGDDDQYGLPIYGSDFADTLHGTDGDDLIYSGGGNDTVIGWNGDDLIFGETGNDNLFGRSGNDFILGNEGADFIDGGDGNDQLFGGEGNDTLVGRNGNDRLFGEAGNDKLHGLEGDDLLAGGLGSDLLEGGTGNDHLAGGSGNDVLKGGDGDDELFGDEGNDTLFGGAGADFMDGGAGIDTASYAKSKSGVEVYMNSDSLSKGDAKGDTFLNIENVTGSAYADVIVGDGQTTLLDGGDGDDRLFAGRGNDTLIGGNGNDQLNGGWGDDMLRGGAGNDIIFGYIGDDQLFGGSGNDKLIAGAGNDDLIGGSGNDFLQGDTGNDFFAAGTGNDEIHMGEGNDYYLLQSAGDGTSYGADFITDFDVQNDLIIFESKAVTADTINSFFQQTGEGLLIEVDNSSVLLQGVTADDLNTSSNFEFG